MLEEFTDVKLTEKKERKKDAISGTKIEVQFERSGFSVIFILYPF